MVPPSCYRVARFPKFRFNRADYLRQTTANCNLGRLKAEQVQQAIALQPMRSVVKVLESPDNDPSKTSSPMLTALSGSASLVWAIILWGYSNSTSKHYGLMRRTLPPRRSSGTMILSLASWTNGSSDPTGLRISWWMSFIATGLSVPWGIG